MFLLLIAYWMWAFLLSIGVGAVLGFMRAGKQISKTNAGITPGKAVLLTFGSIACLFFGWAALVASEATLMTDGEVNTGAMGIFALLGVALTFFGSFSASKLCRLLHFSNATTPPAAK